MTPYLKELRENWRPIAAAFIGLSGSLMMTMYVVGVMAPYLIADFNWDKSQFSLIAGLGLITVFAFPIIGRITDLVGVRNAAMVGAVGCPLTFLAMSQLQNMQTYAFLFALQCLLMVTTTPPVYCRIVVQYVERARGMALAIVASGAGLSVAIGGPLLNDFIADHGWRAGYVALAIFTAIIGLIAIMLIPPERKTHAAAVAKPKASKADYAKIFRTPAFWILFAATLLTMPPQTVMATQLNLVLAENGAAGKAASILIGLYAGGMLVGRFIGGFALDRFPAPIVATVGLLLSAVGLFLFGAHLESRPLLMAAALLFGLTVGAENDVVAYLIVRNFGVRIYSTVHGLMAGTSGLAAVIGIVLNSVLLKLFGNFAPFLIASGVLVAIGALLFLLLPFNPKTPGDEKAAEQPDSIKAERMEGNMTPIAQGAVGRA